VPIAVTFHNVPTDYVPTTSENGTTWRAIPLLAALPLPDGQPDGYVRDGHTLTIYTHHLSLFAVHRLKTSSTASAKAAAAAKASAAKKKAAAAAKAKAAQQSVWGPLASVRVGTLPLAIQKPAVVALPGGQIMVIGGQSSKGSSSTILVGAPEKLHAIGQLRFANYGGDAVGDAFRIGNTIWLVGGHAGDRTTSALYRIDATTGKVTPSGRFIEPLADSGVVSVAGTTYLVGGVSGTRVATAVLSYAPPSDVEIVTRLPIGVSDPSVVAVGGLIYVAGGATQSGGASKAVFVVNPAAHTVKRFATLPEGVTNASVVAAGKSLYLLGGTSAKGNPLFNLMRINLQTRRVSVVGKLTHPLIGAATVAVGNRTLVIGGKRGGVGTYSADITAITAKGGSRTALNG
jgi:hypothetical protein